MVRSLGDGHACADEVHGEAEVFDGGDDFCAVFSAVVVECDGGVEGEVGLPCAVVVDDGVVAVFAVDDE